MSSVPKDWIKIGPFVVALLTAGAAWGASQYQIMDLQTQVHDLKSQLDRDGTRLRRIEFIVIKLAQKQGIPTDRIEE